MYVWRIPLLLFAPLVATVVLVVSGAALLALRDRASRLAVRRLLLALTFLAFAAGPILVASIVDANGENASGVMRTYVHPSMATLWSPTFIAALILRIGRRPLFCASALLFATLNVTNWCNPDWCERYGFPLPYRWSSDAVVVLDGANVTAGVSHVALAANVALFALAVLVTARNRRTSHGAVSS